MRTCQLVTDSALQTAIPDLLAQWEADRTAEGWSVFPRLVAGRTGLSVPLAANRPDHTFLIGDDVPFTTTMAIPDGHYELGPREIEADYKYVNAWGGAIGRVWYGNVPGAGKSSAQLYREYFDKRHRWAIDALQIPVASSVIDYLSDGRYPQYEGAFQYSRNNTPYGLHEERYGSGPGVDDNFQRLSKDGRLMVEVYSGGYGSYPPAGFYIVGGPDLWKQYDPIVGIFGGFGSLQCQLRATNSFLTFALTGSHTVVSFYNQGGSLPYWRMLLGATAGDCGRMSAGFLITNVLGDPTVMLPGPVLSAAQFMQAVNSTPSLLSAYTATFGAAPPVITPVPLPVPPPIVPAITINWARYEQVANPTVYKDATNAVSIRVLAGGPWWVYDETRPCLTDPVWGKDPYPGVLKQLTISWTNAAGVTPPPQTFKQRDQVIMA